MTSHRLKAAVLGATGSVGQKLVLRLHDHPWFSLVALAASRRSAGRRYGDAVHWLEQQPLPGALATMEVLPVSTDLDCDVVFSALDAATAAEVEPRLAAAGLAVVSNASALRQDPRVPLVVPEVNPDHVELVRAGDGGAGFVVTNPNCATVGLVMTLRPLLDAFGLERVVVTTLQAISGAGYPGLSSMDVLGNVVPHIPGEEDKLEREPAKILGRLVNGHVQALPLEVSAQVNRVPVLDGHLLCVSARLGQRVGPAEVREALAGFRGTGAPPTLPSAPERPLHVFADGPFPQPRLHAGLDGGMTVSVGRVRPCPVQDVRYVALVHNTVRGAAGAAILNAELLVQRGLLG